MDPMIDFVRERTADLQRTADSVRRDRDLRQPAPLGVAVVAGSIARPTAMPVAHVTATPATTEVCGPCPSDTARQAA